MSDALNRIEAFGAKLVEIGAEFSYAIADIRVWLSILTGLLLGAFCCLLGTWMARRVGLLPDDAPHGETLGVGMATGLIIVATIWAALWSGGRSAFTPIAVALAAGVLLGGDDPQPGNRLDRGRWPAMGPILRTALASALFVVAVGFLYGVTMAPSPRDGAQPIEFFDVAYYSVLGRNLASTGTESIFSPSGFGELPGLPTQTWYHWGEAWLSASLITVASLDPIFARHYAVLPLILLSGAALTGTLVRRLTGTPTRGAFLFGAGSCLVLAPILLPWPGPFFSKWASGLLFGVTQYGLGLTVALLALYVLAGAPSARSSVGLTVFCGAAIACLLPAHIVLAALALAGLAGAGLTWAVRSAFLDGHLPTVAPVLGRVLIAAAVIGVATGIWGIWTGHGVGASAISPSVSPFNGAWVQTMIRTVLGAGVLLAVPFAWRRADVARPLRAHVFVGTTFIVFVGALSWGARLGDLNMFHVFFGGLAVFAVPAAAAAFWIVWTTARRAGRRRVASSLFVLCGVQLGLASGATYGRLDAFSPPDYEPIPLVVLEGIKSLPTDAKLAYTCRSLEEASFWDPSLVSIDAHTGRSVVPMCFQAEFFTWMLTGIDSSVDVENPLFRFAPQRALYSTADATPSHATVAAFLSRHGIDYIYADRDHPNSLGQDAVVVVSSGNTQVLRTR